MSFDVIGKKVERIDSRAKATGEARFTVDTRLPANSYAKFIRCPYPHARIKSVDASEVMKSLLKDMYKAQEFINNGDNNLAEKKYLSIISKDKYMYQAYYNLGILYLQTNRKEEAKDIFSKMLNINPNDEQVIKLLNGLRL